MNQDIQRLRGVAILLILYEHLYPYLLPKGSDWYELVGSFRKFSSPWSGVDLFLVISGFVISGTLIEKLDSHATAEGRWKETIAFWIKRFYRLFPTATFWLLLTLAGSMLCEQSNAFGYPHDNMMELATYLTQTRNIAYGYGIPGELIGSYWSLSLEAQFYLLFPAILFFIRSNKRRVAFFAAVVVAQFFVFR